MKTITLKPTRIAVYLLLLAALLGFSLLWLSQAQAATLPADFCTVDGTTRTCELWATTGAINLPGVTGMPIWGYSTSSTPGTAVLPGPAIIANQGETVQVILHNMLGETTGLYFQGQAMRPDLVGIAAGADNALSPYSFIASQPGTFLYEAALLPNSQHQAALGMFGALIVRPAGFPNQAYTSASTAFNDEALVILSEIDPLLNNAADPALFDMRNFTPRYWLINGKAYPDTAEIASAAGNQVLLRYINAGLQPHTMNLLGLDQALLGVDGSPLPYVRKVTANTLAPGQTLDTLVSMPVTAPAGGGKYALYDGSFLTHNNGAAGFGGMLTFLTITDGTPPGAGPVTTVVTLTPTSKTGGAAPDPVTLSATISGLLNITDAEYFVDAVGISGSGCDMTGVFGSPPVAVSAVIPTSGAIAPCTDLTTLAHGAHTFYVHGQDSSLVWGAFNFAVLSIDKEGPMAGGITLSPNPSFGNVTVSISATGDDSMHGGSNVVAAEYAIDDMMMGPWMPMTVSPIAPIANLSATISAATMLGLSEGEHTVYIHATDVFGNEGMHEMATLKVDKTGPVGSGVTTTPNLLYAPAAVRVNATFSDPLSGVPGVNSNLKKAEGFINTVGGSGTGFPMTPRDGLFNSPAESAYADIPLATVSFLGPGTHTIYVHAQDSSGNWGDANAAFATFTLLPDLIFADGFESGSFSAWLGGTGGTAGVVSVTSAAARAPSSFGMQAVLAGVTPGYAIDTSPQAEPGYRARFYFNPNSTATGNNGTPVIFAGLDSANVVRVQVQYNRTNAGVYRVRLVVTHAAGTATSAWTTISNAWTAIEISWQAANPATFRLYTGGVLRQTLTGLNTSAYRLESVRLGPSGSLSTNVVGTMYFDDFVSRRNTYIGP